jgi:hypothetical protein
MMLCDFSVFFNSFADAFGLMSRKLSSESRQVLVRFQSSESFGCLQYAGGGLLLREYWSTRSACTLIDCQPEWPPSWARPTPIFMPQSAYILTSRHRPFFRVWGD